MRTLHMIILVTLLLFQGIPAFSQNSNAILFTENGEKFTAILNGLRQNDKPETNVKITGLNANFYKLTVIFADAALGQSKFNMGIDPGTETTYIIKKNNKGEYVLRPMSMVPIAEAPPVPAGTAVNTYNPNAEPYSGETIITEQTTVTTTTGMPATGVSVGINVNETNGNMTMNVSGYDATNSTVTTQQITTTTTTSTSSVSAPPPPPPAVYVPGYNGAVGCPVPMNQGDFESMKGSITSKSFEESKLTLAKQVINNNCLLSAQVKEIMQLFTFEESKLDYAKYAYGRTYDIGNYYKVNDAFTFETSIEELNSYISSYRR